MNPTNNWDYILDTVKSMGHTDPIEIRFQQTYGNFTTYQLIAYIGTQGLVVYDLKTHPASRYGTSIYDLGSADEDYFQPIKPYIGWKTGVAEWLLHRYRPDGSPLYLVSEII